MKQLSIILLCCSVAFTSCKKETIRGGGAVKTESRTLPAFTNIELGGSAEATISYGATLQVTVTGYENLLPVYETKVQGNTVYLQFRSDIYNVKNSNIKVNITLPLLAYLRVNGSGKISAGQFQNGDELTASINGSGDIVIDNSKYNKVSYSVNGSGEIRAASSIATEAAAAISGSGKIELKVTNKLKATISGSGNIDYWGNPGSIESAISGSGKVTKR